ncbi:MAG: hypothetical protein DHS20C15_05480 [Planctomycetota bacterium]|nr:MAG: hypothetical protein DHS20C15_05480 [Planctomycetota bacterium]
MDAARPPTPRRRPSRLRKLLIQLALVLLIVLGAEWSVRAMFPRSSAGGDAFVGFTGDTPLFVLDDSGDTFVTNPLRNRPRESFNPQQFAADKAAGTKRVACVGGSTTYGRPYRDATSFPGWLRAALPLADPWHDYEVINAGGISYASYRVARVVDELLRHDLDLLVIYTGHNEFLEEITFGDTLKDPSALRRVASWLDTSALFGLARRLAGVDAASAAPATTLPDQVAPLLDSSVGLDAYTRDDTRAADILAHFRASVERMLAAAHAAEVPVLLVAPASQLVGCAPFKSAPDDGLSESQLADFATHLALADDNARAFDQRRAAALRANLIAPRHAHAAYLDGELALRVGDREHAARALRRARDQDLVPLRAPSPFVNTVRELARDERVWFLDAELLLAKRAERLTGIGLPGPESFLDHVHMTPEAYAELAFALLDVLVDNSWLPRAPEFDAAARAELVATRVSALDTEDHVRALERLSAVLDWAGKREEAEALSLRAQELGGGASAFGHWQQGHFARARGDLEGAAEAYARALELDPEYLEALLNRGEVLLRLERPREAREHFETALALDPELLAARFGLGVALGQLGERAAERAAYQAVLASDATHADAWKLLAISYNRDGRATEALDSLSRGRLAVPNNPALAFNHGVLLRRAGELDAARAAFERALELAPDNNAARVQLEELR